MIFLRLHEHRWRKAKYTVHGAPVYRCRDCPDIAYNPAEVPSCTATKDGRQCEFPQDHERPTHANAELIWSTP